MTFSTILERYLVREVNIMPYLEDLEQNLVKLVAELLHEYCVAIFYKMDLGIQFSQLKWVCGGAI